MSDIYLRRLWITVHWSQRTSGFSGHTNTTFANQHYKPDFSSDYFPFSTLKHKLKSLCFDAVGKFGRAWGCASWRGQNETFSGWNKNSRSAGVHKETGQVKMLFFFFKLLFGRTSLHLVKAANRGIWRIYNLCLKIDLNKHFFKSVIWF